jgi:ABC-type multidrug transport system ATPase subunit
MEHVRVGGQSMRVESFLDRFLFPGPTKFSRVEDLSGGERNRVLLAKLLIQAGNVVVLDEPTNDLDLETLRTLEEALVAFEGAALIVSHDRWFLDRVATHVLHLDGEGNARLHVGDLSRCSKIARERAAEETRRRRRRRPRSAGRRARRSPANRPARCGGASLLQGDESPRRPRSRSPPRESAPRSRPQVRRSGALPGPAAGAREAPGRAGGAQARARNRL